MIVRVSKRRWLRGDNGRCEPGLLEGTKMCCLGFAARQLGQTCADIRGVDMPGSIAPDRLSTAMIDGPFLARAESYEGDDRWVDSSLSSEASKINDDSRITDTERMKQLRVLFKKHGHRIVFVA